MHENKCAADVPTADELLAEVGLEAYTIHRIRAEGERVDSRSRKKHDNSACCQSTSRRQSYFGFFPLAGELG